MVWPTTWSWLGVGVNLGERWGELCEARVSSDRNWEGKFDGALAEYV